MQPGAKSDSMDSPASNRRGLITISKALIDVNNIWCRVDALYDECENWEDYCVQRNAPEYEETLEEEPDRLDREMLIHGL